MSGWKTFLINGAILLGMIVDYFMANNGIVREMFATPERGAMMVAAISAVNIVLRFVTSTAIFTARQEVT